MTTIREELSWAARMPREHRTAAAQRAYMALRRRAAKAALFLASLAAEAAERVLVKRLTRGDCDD
jgi:hypothetical protein